MQVGELRLHIFGVLLCGFQVQIVFLFLVLLHLGADDEDLSSVIHLLADEAVEPLTVALVYQQGVNGLSAGRKLVYNRNIKVAV